MAASGKRLAGGCLKCHSGDMARAVAFQLAMFKQRQQTWCVQRPSQKPASRYSLAYCLWLAKSAGQRYEVMRRQRFLCWECGYVLSPRWVHLHHPLGYDNLGQEEASDLVAVHSRCHRNIHEADRKTFEWAGVKAA